MRMLGYDKDHDRHGTYLVMTKSGRVLRREVRKWHENVFDFRTLESLLGQTSAKDDDSSVRADVAKSTAAPARTLNGASSRRPSGQEQKVQARPVLPPSTRSSQNGGDDTKQRPRRRRKTPHRMGFVPCLSSLHVHEHMNYTQELVQDETRDDTGREDRFYSCLQSTEAENLCEFVCATSEQLEDIPKSFKEAVTGKDKHKWIPSIKSELRSLIGNHTWDLVRKTKKMNLVSTKWVFKNKLNADGTIRHKSRLVARGFNQIKGKDWFKSYAPTLSLSSLRILLSLASKHKMHVHNVDITTAYLYGQVDADIHLSIPEGLEPSTAVEEQIMRDGGCLRLNKALYGLVQAGYIWNRTFVKSLKSWEFRQLKTDPCIFVLDRQGRKLILGIYVDDILACYNDKKDLDFFIEKLKADYKFKDLGPVQKCLGVEIERDFDGNFTIHQHSCLKILLEKCKIQPSKRAKTPITKALDNCFPGEEPSESNAASDFTIGTKFSKVDPTAYKSLLGALLYMAVATRPDISYALSILARFAAEPKKMHMDALLRLAKHLANTQDYRITYGKPSQGFVGYADASFAKEEGMKSTSGYFLSHCGGPVIWGAHKQKVLAHSIAEAECMSLSQLGRDII